MSIKFEYPFTIRHYDTKALKIGTDSAYKDFT